jgi:hypothetical protein
VADEPPGKPATVVTRITRLAVDFEELMDHLKVYALTKMEPPEEGYNRQISIDIPFQPEGQSKIAVLNVYDSLPDGHQLMLGPGEKAQ